jgi:hypothetical protein
MQHQTMTKKHNPEPNYGRIEFTRQWVEIRKSLDEGWSIAKIYRYCIDTDMISYSQLVRLVARKLAAEKLMRGKPEEEIS